MVTDDTPRQGPNLEQWHVVARRAAPAIGAVILVWSSLEAIMKSMVIAVRGQQAYAENKRMNFKLSHKPRERVNEWIRLVLVPSGLGEQADGFRAEFMRLKVIRDNLAHNIASMFINRQDQLIVVTMFDRKDYEKEASQWLERWAARGGGDEKDRHPSPFGSALYTEAEIMTAYEDMRQTLTYVNHVHQAPQLPESPSGLEGWLDPLRHTEAGRPANPKS